MTRPVRAVLRDAGGRLWWAGVVLAVLGSAVTALLLLTGSSIHLARAADDQVPAGVVIPGDRSELTISCYPVLSSPDGVSRAYGRPISDEGLNDTDGQVDDRWALRVQQYCERLRSERTGWALLVALPTLLLGSGVIASSVLRRRQEDVED